MSDEVVTSIQGTRYRWCSTHDSQHFLKDGCLKIIAGAPGLKFQMNPEPCVEVFVVLVRTEA